MHASICTCQVFNLGDDFGLVATGFVQNLSDELHVCLALCSKTGEPNYKFSELYLHKGGCKKLLQIKIKDCHRLRR